MDDEEKVIHTSAVKVKVVRETIGDGIKGYIATAIRIVIGFVIGYIIAKVT